MTFFKKSIPFVLFFIVYLFYNLMISPMNLDEVWSYGFTHAIYLGEIPYRDFNMVIPPLYPFLMSIPMHIFGNNILVFHIENAIIITLFLYFCFQMLKEKTYYILPFLIFPLNVTFPNYNFVLLLLFTILLQFEQKEKNDYVIGFFYAIIFLIKQTVGLPLILISLYYYQTPKKLKKRMVGFVLPILIFGIYLLFTSSFFSFLDICFFGLLDFGAKNGKIRSIYFYMTILLIVIVFLFIRKEKKNMDYGYFFFFLINSIPLFDLYHFQLLWIFFLIIFLKNHDIHYQPKLIGLSLWIGFLFISTMYSEIGKAPYPNSISHFEYRFLPKRNIQYTKMGLELMNKYPKAVFIDPNAHYFKIILNQKITKLDLINMGNNGYHGSDKLIQKIKELDGEYVFFVNPRELGTKKQTDQKLIRYIMKQGRLIEKTPIYDVYTLEGEKND